MLATRKYKKFNIYFLFLFSLFLQVLDVSNLQAMTDQAPDKLIYGGQKFYIEQAPFEGKLQGHENENLIFMTNSSNWKGYLAEWEIIGNDLYLIKFQADGKKGKLKINSIMSNAKLPLKAKWFTGNLQIRMGDLEIGDDNRAIA